MVDVKKYINQATYLTAVSVSRLIAEKGFSPSDILDEKESLDRERMIDAVGADAMREALKEIPFVLEVVGSEGRKHIHQYGEALPSLEGVFGPPAGGGVLKLDCVNDVVEGSKSAKLNSPGAMSVIAVSSHKGLMPTPPDIDYMDKLFGPPQLKGKISINNSVEENLKTVVDTFKVKPSEVNVLMMDRDRNAHYIEACKKFGVNLILLNAMDFIASIFCSLDPNKHKKGIHILMGNGGFEEGVMAVVAAKALGAACEGKGWSSDPDIQKKYATVWSINDIVPGKLEDCLLSLSTITVEDRWFNLEPLSTLTVTADGVKISSNG